MNRTAAVNRIKQGVGFRSDLDTVIISALQEAQRELEGGQTLPWFLLQEDQTFAITTVNLGAVPLPTGFLQFHKDEGPRTVDPTTLTDRFLTAKPYDEAKEFYKTTENGPPLAFTLRSTTVKFWPTPDAAYNVTASYYKRAALLDSDIENAWLADTGCPDLLIARAGLIVAVDLENETSTKKFAAMFTKWQSWLIAQMTDREESVAPRAMGRNH